MNVPDGAKKIILKTIEDYPELKKDIEEGNWIRLYYAIPNNVHPWWLTQVILEAGLDPLKGKNYVPSYLYGNWEGDIIIPEGVRFIRINAFFAPGNIGTLYLPSSLETIDWPMFGSEARKPPHKLVYNGTEEEWKKLMRKNHGWCESVIPTHIVFSDKEIKID